MRERLVQRVRLSLCAEAPHQVLQRGPVFFRWRTLACGSARARGRCRPRCRALRPGCRPLDPGLRNTLQGSLGEVGGDGAMLPKTTTPTARAGNPPPRIAETPAGMVNSIGLQNPGVEDFLQISTRSTSASLSSSSPPAIPSTSSPFARPSTAKTALAVELNLSCPNECGSRFCAGPASVEEVVAACRAAVPGKRLLAKLTNEGVVENARAAESVGADGLRHKYPPGAHHRRSRPQGSVRGGLSGPAIKPAALRAVYDVSGVVNIPVIGGQRGVVNGTDVVGVRRGRGRGSGRHSELRQGPARDTRRV